VDEAVIKYYRRLLREGFEHAGSFHNPSIFLDSVGEGIRVCGRATGYMHIFINVSNKTIDDIKYLCTCDPTANVAVEVLCDLVKGKTLEEAATTPEDSFFRVVGSRSEELRKKAKGLLELLNRGLIRYQTEISVQKM
jgi:NifU-like protein involved in Fe-S cluster formation